MNRFFMLITCEHGGNRIAAEFRPLFRGHGALLESHRGYDLGALPVARDLAAALGAELVFSETSRLLVDLNRSLGHPGLFSEITRTLPRGVRQEILERYYRPYRRHVETLVQNAIAAGASVIHISSHSFTPELDGVPREADVGLLYDPRRAGEVALCARWSAALRRLAPQLRVRRNYPYTGRADGLCTHLRGRLPPERYAGIELEINHKHVLAGGRAWHALRRMVVASLREAIEAELAQGSTMS